MFIGTSAPFSCELYWFLPKSAKPFLPRSLQERQRSSAEGGDQTDVEKLINQHISSKDEEERKLKWKDGIPLVDSGKEREDYFTKEIFSYFGF